MAELSGTYGGSKTPCTVYTVTDRNGTWYAVEGSLNVNQTLSDLEDGVDVETLDDIDHFTAGEAIESESDLENAVEDQ